MALSCKQILAIYSDGNSKVSESHKSLEKCRIRYQNPLKEARKRHSPFEVSGTQCTIFKAWLGFYKRDKKIQLVKRLFNFPK